MAQLMVLMFTDIVDSVNMKRELGGPAYEKLSQRHDELLGAIVGSIPDGKIIKDTGDGFLVRFRSSSDAVRGALRFQSALHAESAGPRPIRVRIGIHSGEASELGLDALGAPKIVGLAADMAARLMGLALPGQILLSRSPFDDARQYLGDNPLNQEQAPTIKWMAHGAYRFKGNDDPLTVFEVGVEGVAPLSPPPDGDKARRAVTAIEEALLGWRPAAGLEVPTRHGWLLENKLGEGGFGEVWLALHHQTREKRVFKFCFDSDRLHSFKRELTLFRLIRESLGERRDIARLYEIQLEQAPYFLESEYTSSGDLAQWATTQGGVKQVPLAVRLALVARVAEAAAAAHSIGILHKDIKPSNILIYGAEDGSPRPRLADFGIGMITDSARLGAKNITIAGFTQAELEGEAPYTGTQLYAPPETLIGKPFTIQGDIYALGILLYQMVVGDLEAPLGAGWEREIASPELREDIARCVDYDPERRLRSATELAKRLDEVEQRATQRRRSTRRTRFRRLAAVSSALLLVIATALTLHVIQVSRERDRAAQEAETARQVSEFLIGLFEVSDPGEARGNTITAREILDQGAASVNSELQNQPRVRANLLATMGNVYHSLGLYREARPLLEEALSLRSELLQENAPELAASLRDMGMLLWRIGDYDAARPLLERALALREKNLGPNHPDVAESLSNMAALLRALGDLDGAQPLYERALAIRETNFGPQHPAVAESLSNLAALLSGRHEYSAARPLLERSLAIQEAAYGPNHPDVAGGLSNMALLLKKMDDLQGAEVFSERALAIEERVLGPDHLFVAASLNNLGRLRLDLGQYDRARPMLERSLAIREQALGPDQPQVAQSLNNLADLLAETGNFGAARPLYERALRIREATLGPDHPIVAWNLEGLGRLLVDTGEYAAAEGHFRRALSIREKKQGPDHPDVAESLQGYIRLLRKLGRNGEADELGARAISIREKVPPA